MTREIKSEQVLRLIFNKKLVYRVISLAFSLLRILEISDTLWFYLFINIQKKLLKVSYYLSVQILKHQLLNVFVNLKPFAASNIKSNTLHHNNQSSTEKQTDSQPATLLCPWKRMFVAWCVARRKKLGIKKVRHSHVYFGTLLFIAGRQILFIASIWISGWVNPANQFICQYNKIRQTTISLSSQSGRQTVTGCQKYPCSKLNNKPAIRKSNIERRASGNFFLHKITLFLFVDTKTDPQQGMRKSNVTDFSSPP